MTVTDTWSPARAPYLRPDEDDEPPYCASHYYPAPGGVRVGPLVCGDYVGHPQSGGPGSDHSGGAPGFPFWWNDAEALESLAEFGPSARKTGPPCTECETRPQHVGGRCWHCATDLLARDDIETEMESA
jgi:hypothetical protein